METANPMYPANGGSGNVSDHSVAIISAAVTDSSRVDVVEEFQALFQQVSVKNSKEESPLMEQANVLMGKKVFDENEIDPLDKEDYGNENVKVGSKIARKAVRALDGRQPSPPYADGNACWACLFEPRAMDLEPLSDAEFEYQLLKLKGLRLRLFQQQEHGDVVFSMKKYIFATDMAMKTLSEFLWRHPSYTAFTFEHCSGMFGERGLALAHAIHNHPNIKVINFNHTDATVEFTSSIGMIARFALLLETVTLKETEIRDLGAMFWGMALLRGAPLLKYLDLSGGKIRSRGATALALGLKAHRRLRVLNLSNNRISRIGCMRLGEALVENPLLEELNLSGNSIGSRGASAIAAFLTHPNAKLRILIMTHNDIGPKGGKALAIGVSMNKSLVRLTLARNDMGDEGVAGFGPALEKNSTLEDLDLSDNDATDIGAAAVASGLKTNSTLRVLYLSNQIIRDAGADELGNCLALNQGLKVLNLTANAISDQGATGLAKMLRANSTLEELRLNDNEISNIGGVELAKVLNEKANRKLLVLDLTNNPISADISKKWFAVAESRVVTSSTQRIDIIAEGTAIARGNLREFGVVVMRTRTSGFWTVIMIFFTLFISWFDFVSDIVVAANEIIKYQEGRPGASVVYVAMLITFIALPFTYILVFFSLPASETDATLPGIDMEADLMNESLNAHMERLRKSRCTNERFVLTFMNIFQMRLAYELYLSWRHGLTTLAFSSIRLVEVVFEALPQAMIQLHIIFSAPTLAKIKAGNIINTTDTTVIALLVSITISMLTLSRTLSDLFEKKFVVNWKRNSFHYEEFAFYTGMGLAFLYHLFHFAMRAITIALAATIYHGMVCGIFFAAGVIVRGILGYLSGSERRRTFAMVSYFVGSASWDTRLVCRICHFLEIIECAAVIVPLWMPLPAVINAYENIPLLFQDGYVALVDIGSAPIVTGILGGCCLLANVLYLAFIERIHSYGDVILRVDLDSVEALANRPFEENVKAIRDRRREKLMKGGGEVARYGQLMDHVGPDNGTRTSSRGKRGFLAYLFGTSESNVNLKKDKHDAIVAADFQDASESRMAEVDIRA